MIGKRGKKKKTEATALKYFLHPIHPFPSRLTWVSPFFWHLDVQLWFGIACGSYGASSPPTPYAHHFSLTADNCITLPVTRLTVVVSHLTRYTHTHINGFATNWLIFLKKSVISWCLSLALSVLLALFSMSWSTSPFISPSFTAAGPALKLCSWNLKPNIMLPHPSTTPYKPFSQFYFWFPAHLKSSSLFLQGKGSTFTNSASIPWRLIQGL